MGNCYVDSFGLFFVIIIVNVDFKVVDFVVDFYGIKRSNNF